MIKIIHFMVLLLFLSPPLILSQPEEEIILKTVQQFCDALENRDTTLAREVLFTDGQFFSVRDNESDIAVKRTRHADVIHKLTESEEPMREVLHNPMVLIHKSVAVVWSKYKFYRNGEYSHSGMDAFSLIKTLHGWKIAGIVYNIE